MSYLFCHQNTTWGCRWPVNCGMKLNSVVRWGNQHYILLAVVINNFLYICCVLLLMIILREKDFVDKCAKFISAVCQKVNIALCYVTWNDMLMLVWHTGNWVYLLPWKAKALATIAIWHLLVEVVSASMIGYEPNTDTWFYHRKL